jgi:hypothetical protein
VREDGESTTDSEPGENGQGFKKAVAEGHGLGTDQRRESLTWPRPKAKDSGGRTSFRSGQAGQRAIRLAARYVGICKVR